MWRCVRTVRMAKTKRGGEEDEVGVLCSEKISVLILYCACG